MHEILRFYLLFKKNNSSRKHNTNLDAEHLRIVIIDNIKSTKMYVIKQRLTHKIDESEFSHSYRTNHLFRIIARYAFIVFLVKS